jgi:glycogenin glucosyltransferase
LVTPETVDAGTIGKLREAWDLVVGVEVLEHENQSDGLKLLGE